MTISDTKITEGHLVCASDIGRRAAKFVSEIRAVRDQSAGGRKETALEINRRHSVTGRERYDQFAIKHRRRARGYDHAAIRGIGEGRNGSLNLTRLPHVDRPQVHANRRRYRLDDSKLRGAGGYRWIAQNRRSRYPWRDLLEQFNRRR
jgi:hypothetical protein